MNQLKLWKIGLIIFILAGLANGLLVSAGIGGLVRELMRLTILVGLGILILGIVRAFKKDKKT